MVYLLNEEKKYLLELLKKQPSWWVKDKLIEKIEQDEQEKENTKNCEHTFYEINTKKVCCIKCGTYADGMGFKREYAEVKAKNYETPKFLTPIELLVD